MKRFLRRLLWFLVLAGMAGALFFAMRPEPVEVEAARVTRGPLQVTVDEDGEVRSHDRFVVAAPVAGRLARIELHDGDAVALGQVVASLSPLPLDPKGREEAEARLRSVEALQREAVARVERARADLELHRRDRERAEQLARTGDIPQQTLDQRRNAESTAAKELEAARFRAQSAAFDVESARAALLAVTRPTAAASKVLVRAPVKGHVLRVLEASERVVPAGTPLVLLGEESKHLEVVVDVLSTDAVKISPGAMMWLDGWGGPKPLRAQVRRVEPYAFTKVSVLGIEEQRVNVIGDFLDPPGPLGDGYRVEARIVIWEKPDVVKLPLSALFRQGDRWAVFRVEGGRALVSTVEVDHRNSLEAEVLGGIGEGAEVIVHPSNELKEGGRVVVQPANSAKSSIQ
ncbi:MAG: efflux RND transporter periplasmic adaptor subunit [Bryobacterales bacterium]|nr:efflux RND transporter periplasmic adaptor subunit [Bryobacterales bacterium]